jgi:hypothetical protein
VERSPFQTLPLFGELLTKPGGTAQSCELPEAVREGQDDGDLRAKMCELKLRGEPTVVV